MGCKSFCILLRETKPDMRIYYFLMSRKKPRIAIWSQHCRSLSSKQSHTTILLGVPAPTTESTFLPENKPMQANSDYNSSRNPNTNHRLKCCFIILKLSSLKSSRCHKQPHTQAYFQTCVIKFQCKTRQRRP